MVKVYYNRVVSGQITFAEVPDSMKAQVKLYAQVQVEEGKLSQDDYDRLFGE